MNQGAGEGQPPAEEQQRRTADGRIRAAVCIIVENLPVPLDRRVWQEALALRHAGYRVSVISPKMGAFRRSYEVCEGVEIYRHPVWEASGPFGYLLEYAWALAAEFVLALEAYRRSRFRILQTCNPPDTMFLIGWFFRLFGVRFIFDHHDLNPELFEAKFGKKGGLFYRFVCLAERMTYRAARVSIATNESYREVAVTRGKMRPDRVFVVRSTPDLESMPAENPSPELKEGRQFLVVYRGVMGSQDGLDLLIESIEIIVKRQGREDTLFVLVGDGTEAPRVREMAANKGLNHAVRFPGRLPLPELVNYLSTADVGVAPDPLNPMNDKSTMNKVLEYMAYGKPVVLYDLAEGRRAAGDAALYAQPNHPEDFAAKIIELLDSEPLRRRLGDAGRRRINGELSWETQKRELLKAYETALSG